MIARLPEQRIIRPSDSLDVIDLLSRLALAVGAQRMPLLERPAVHLPSVSVASLIRAAALLGVLLTVSGWPVGFHVLQATISVFPEMRK